MKKKVLLFLSLAILGQPWNARGSTAPNAGPNLSISKRVNAPTVSVVSPAANAVFSEGQPVTITASVSDPEAAISKVEFYSGTTKIGEDLFSPYSITWTDIPAGSYVITAKAYSESGAEATSEEVVFTVGDRVNQAPVVSIVTPSSNAAIAEGETVVISVNASDADGSVAKVELFSGSVKIAERTSLPYTFNWSDLAAGTYTITVRATDKEGAVASSSVTFSVYAVTPGVPPVVEITSPSNNASFEEGRVITINADASDADGTIEKVEYYNGTTLIGQELYEPYSLLWNNAPVGTHTITVKAIDNSGLFTVSAPITVVVTERSALKAPFHGTPAEIPGRIEAEDFDLGGLHIAYYDDTPDNKGGHYRDEYVDIEKCAEGGYDIGYMDIGEWLDYTVEVKETGTYELGVRVGSPNTGKVLHVEMNGLDISGPVTVPNTGDWQKYVTVKVPNIELTAGVQTMRIVMDSAEFNLNYVEFKKISAPTTESTPFHGTPAIIPGRIEAEDYDLGGLDIAYYDDTPDNKGGQYRDDYVDIENCAEGGYDIGFMDIGEWLNYTVEVEETGTYELGVRVGSPNTGKILHIEMNGVDISGPVEVPNTGDWQKYVTVKVPNIELTAGVQIMRIVMDSAEFNLNWVEFKKVSTPPVTESTPFHGTPAIIPGRIEAEDYDLGGLNVAYYDDTPDNKGGQYRDDYVDIERSLEGGYNIGYMDIGEWLNYTVEVKETGLYELGVRAGSPYTGKVMHIEMNGVDISGPIEVPNTGAWQKYETVRIPNIPLSAGVQVMKIVLDSAEFLLNWVEFIPVKTPSDSTDTCLLTVAPESSKFVIRNGFGDQYSGAGLSNVDGALQIVQRQWGQSHLYVIESASKYSVEAGKAYTISFDFKDDELNNVVSIETGFGKSIEWNGTIDAQPLAVIEGPFSSVDFEKQSVTFNALSTGNYYLVVKLNWRGQPNARVTTFIKNISVCEEIAMPSAQMAANGEMSIAGPNPFNDETLIYIPFAGNGNAEAYVNITDVYGKPVTTYSTPFEGQLLPIGKGLAVGIYIVTVSYEGQVYTTRVIKN